MASSGSISGFGSGSRKIERLRFRLRLGGNRSHAPSSGAKYVKVDGVWPAPAPFTATERNERLRFRLRLRTNRSYAPNTDFNKRHIQQRLFVSGIRGRKALGQASPPTAHPGGQGAAATRAGQAVPVPSYPHWCWQLHGAGRTDS